METIWDKFLEFIKSVPPWIWAIVIAIVCLGFKYGDKIVGESEVIHVNNSTNLASLNLGNDGSTKTVYFDMDNYFIFNTKLPNIAEKICVICQSTLKMLCLG